jgi:hypothetical protein
MNRPKRLPQAEGDPWPEARLAQDQGELTGCYQEVADEEEASGRLAEGNLPGVQLSRPGTQWPLRLCWRPDGFSA